MSTCMGCGDQDDVREVRTHDYGIDPYDPWVECYCLVCLAKLRMFCGRHQLPLVSVCDSSEKDQVEEPYKYSFCQFCALEIVSGLFRAQRLEMLVIFELSSAIDGLASFAKQVGERDVVSALDPIDLVIYGAALSASINGETICDFVEDMAFNGEAMTMQ